MRTDKFRKIIRAVETVGGAGGNMKTNIASIVNWTGMPRSTVYRYLNVLTSAGLLEARIEKFRGQYAKMWYMTHSGQEYMRDRF